MTELQHEIPRLVARHGEEIDATYEMLKKTNRKVNKIAAVQKKHGNRLDRIEDRLDGIDGRLDGIDGRLDEHGGKLDDHGRKLDDHGRKLDDHGRKLDEILGLLRKET
jgi:DNA repair ATPase RecN